MYKFHFLILLLILLSGCVRPNKYQEDKEAKDKLKYPIVGFVEDFVAAHPNFDSNDITRQKADADFLSEFKSASDSINLIKGIPVRLKAMNDLENGKVMAQFQSWIKPSNFEFPTPINEVNFDIVGEIDDSYVETLNEDTYYTIHGKFIERIENLTDFFTILGSSSSVYTPSFSVRKDDIWDDKYEVSLGMMYFDIDSISVFVE